MGKSRITFGSALVATCAALALAPAAGADAPAPTGQTTGAAIHEQVSQRSVPRQVQQRVRKLRQRRARKPSKQVAAQAAAITFNIGPAEKQDFLDYLYYNNNWIRGAFWTLTGGLGWVEQWQYWNGRAYVAYAEYICPNGAWSCYRNW
jgi:hypothetical protein